MDLMNLNKLIDQLKKVNEEVVETKRKSSFDLRIYNDLKTKYSLKVKELDEAKEEIEELKRFTKLLGDKLRSLERIQIHNRRLLGKVKRLKGKLESAQNENRFYLNELEEVKILLHNLKNDPLQKVVELQRVLCEKEREYNENLDKIRNETKSSLITLESKIVTKLKTENYNINNNKNDLVKESEVMKRLSDRDEVIRALNISNLRLREKLTLKNVQYRELEHNYLHLKVESQRKIKRKNHMFGDIKSETSWRSFAENNNIEKALKENKFDANNSNNKLNDYLDAKSERDDSSETESTEVLELKEIGFGDRGQTFKLDFKQNEISVEVKNCCESN
ncbi:putative autophagy-related protein 11 [Onthophagus taurus]|uniref:putative autophagy-related protein 11 n=1 Tax=Onthophagus taurus TaxID=166361 RepID=UPI0039BDE009